MCIIQVKAGMRYPTVTQAFAHNAATLAQDCDYLLQYIPTHERSKPHAKEHTRRVLAARAHMQTAYKLLLACWEEAMCDECTQLAPPGTMFDLPDPADTHRHEATSPTSTVPTLTDLAAMFAADQAATQAHLRSHQEGRAHDHKDMDPHGDFDDIAVYYTDPGSA